MLDNSKRSLKMDTQYLKNVKKGMKVEILTKQNRIARGIVEDIVSRAPYQFYGIMVRLMSGEIGRIQKIISFEKKTEDNNVDFLFKKGEDFYTEFKLSCLWSQNYSEEDIKKSRSFDVHYYKQRASKVIIAKSIAAFLNSEGGNLIIGVRESKDERDQDNFEIIGVQDEFKKLKDSNKDGYRRMIIDDVIRPYFPSKIYNHFNQYINIDFIDYNGKILCWIKIKKSDIRVFLNLGDKEIFMIRTETENRALEGEKLVDYCIKHFS